MSALNDTIRDAIDQLVRDEDGVVALATVLGGLFPEWETQGVAAPVDQQLLLDVCQHYGLAMGPAVCAVCSAPITRTVEAHVTVWLDQGGDQLSYAPRLHDHLPREH